MKLEVGTIVEGKVNGITKFGAFISLPNGQSGLVHISEIANTYVSDINDHIRQGDDVKVKVISIGEDGKINLSLKKAEENVRGAAQQAVPVRARTQHPRGPGYASGPAQASSELSFEDKLKQFIQDSDSRMSGNKLYSERKGGKRRKG